MSLHRNDRRDFLRTMACLAASGGAAALVPQLRMIGSAMASPASVSAFTGYKALVCVYLAGGNDAWNTLVPIDDPRYATYVTSRNGIYSASNTGGLALDRAPASGPAQLLPLTGAAGSGSSAYALNAAMPELRTLYDQQRLALVVNAGTLVKPITKTDYANTANRPPQLYSHSDQENLWHVGTARDNALGWGGQTAKLVGVDNANTSLAPCISISGSNKYEVGPGLIPYQIGAGGLQSLSSMCNPTPCGTSGNTVARDKALNALLADSYAGSLYTSEYAKVFKRGRDLYALLNTGLAGLPAFTTNFSFAGGNSLADQLLMVAKMIRLSRQNTYATRQIYYVRLSGFDLHDGLMSGGANGHAALLTRVSQALNAFHGAMGEIGAQNDVTTFTMSEFSRTLSSNGNGSDHAWGTLQMVLGGTQVQGGKLYMDGGGPISGFPNQSIDGTSNNTANTMAFSRGQCIPGIGVEQYAATLAQWMGVASNELDAIFPNLAQFNPNFRNLGFVA